MSTYLKRRSQFAVELPTYPEANEWALLLELHGTLVEQYGRCVVWEIDLNARAPQPPEEAISELRITQEATIGVLAYADVTTRGFNTFGSVPASAFVEPKARREALTACAYLISFLQNIAGGLLEGAVPGRKVDPKKEYN